MGKKLRGQYVNYTSNLKEKKIAGVKGLRWGHFLSQKNKLFGDLLCIDRKAFISNTGNSMPTTKWS